MPCIWSSLLDSSGPSVTHPLEIYRPPDVDKTKSTFCPEKQDGGGAFLQAGSCCTDDEEKAIKDKMEETPNLTDECSALYKQVLFVCPGWCILSQRNYFSQLGDILLLPSSSSLQGGQEYYIYPWFL